MNQISALRSRLEKQPTDLRRQHHYMRGGILVLRVVKRRHTGQSGRVTYEQSSRSFRLRKLPMFRTWKVRLLFRRLAPKYRTQ